jgi:hypothetical protein
MGHFAYPITEPIHAPKYNGLDFILLLIIVTKKT